MAKFTLVSAHANRNPHQGLVVKAYYKQDPSNPFELPHSIVVFNKWPPIEQEAEVIEYKLDGVYEYPNGKRTNCLHLFCPKTQDDNFYMGLSPQEQIAQRMNVLTKIGV